MRLVWQYLPLADRVRSSISLLYSETREIFPSTVNTLFGSRCSGEGGRDDLFPLRHQVLGLRLTLTRETVRVCNPFDTLAAQLTGKSLIPRCSCDNL